MTRKRFMLRVSCFMFHASCLMLLAGTVARAEDEPKPTMGYEDGFFIKSADGNFKFKFNANMQMRYEFRVVEGGNNTNTFAFPRSRLIFTGSAFTPKLTYMFMPEMGDYDQTHTGIGARQSANLYMRDLWFNYAFAKEFEIKLGQFFLPRHRQAYTISPQQQFGEYPITALGDLTFTWDRGVDFHGAISKLDYDAYLTNGSGGDITNASKGVATGMRVVYNVFGKYGYSESDVAHSEDPNVAVGGHVSFNNNDNFNKAAADASPDYLLTSGDVAVKYKGFSFEGEVINLHNYEGGANSPAFTIQAGYFLIPRHLEVAAQASRIFWDGGDNDQSEYIGGVSYYFKGHKVKLHATYSLLIDEDGNGVAGNGFAADPNDQIDHRFRMLAGFAF